MGSADTIRAREPRGTGRIAPCVEFFIEERDRGSTVVRWAHSGFLGDEWEAEYEGMSEGDPMYFHKLAQYLTYFRGRRATPIDAYGPEVSDRKGAVLDESRRPPADQVAQYERMIAEDRRGDAVEYFMTQVVGLPPEFVTDARTQPFWQAQEGLAHTLAYDATIMGDYSLPTDRAASIKAPTLVIAGGAVAWMGETAQALAGALPDGQIRILEGQGHDVDPAVLAPVLVEFFES